MKKKSVYVVPFVGICLFKSDVIVMSGGLVENTFNSDKEYHDFW